MNRYFVILLFLASVVHAQTEKSIEVIAQSKRDSVWLRWAPTSPALWQLGNKYGYTIERFEINNTGELINKDGDRLTVSPLKPLSKKALESLEGTNIDAVALSELLYPEEVTTPQHNSSDPLQALAANEEIENRYGVALLLCDRTIATARAAALFWCDKKVTSGKRYIYKISIAHQLPNLKTEPGVILVEASSEKALPIIKDLKAEFRDRSVMLQWPIRFHKGIYSFYYVEQSIDGKSFRRISDMPYAHMSNQNDTDVAFYVDSLKANYTTYHYRITGVTPFGETGPASNVVVGKGKDDLTGTLIIREVKITTTEKKSTSKKTRQTITPAEKKTSVIVNWEFPPEHEKEIAKFIVSKASSADGPYSDLQNILAPIARTTTDETILNNTYYVIRAIDIDGIMVAQSYPYLVQIEDNTPPAAPIITSGTIDKTGIISLQWKPNSENDFMGYRIFRANSLNEDPVEITKTILAGTQFTDTINIQVLNREVYYYLVAVDKNYNASVYSLAWKALRPDVIAPASPQFTKAEMKKDSIHLQWINSVSADVVKYELSRYEKENRLTRVIMSWTPANLKDTFTDVSLQPGKKYQYKITAYDSAGNYGTATSQEITYENGSRPPIQNINSSIDRNNKLITLSWQYEFPSERCFIYKKINEGNYVLVSTLQEHQSQFTDKAIRISNTYSYKIQLQFKNGVRSTLSEEVVVKF